MQQLNKAKDFFIKNTNYQLADIIKIENISTGYSNYVYKIDTIKNDYYLRLTKPNNLLNRLEEKTVLKKLKIDFDYYDVDGNYIRAWFPGKILNKPWDDFKIEALVEILKPLHKLQTLNISAFDPFQYEVYFEKSKYYKYNNFYRFLLSKYKSLPTSVCHNDLNPLNILWNERTKKLNVIDYERVKTNSIYWEYANCARETMNLENIKYLCKKVDLDHEIFFDFLILTCIHAIQWTLSIKPTKELLTYRENVINRLNYFNEFKNYDLEI